MLGVHPMQLSCKDKALSRGVVSRRVMFDTGWSTVMDAMGLSNGAHMQRVQRG